jgi:hypothetical protein
MKIREKIKAQDRYCKKKGLPHFAPYDGRCYACGRNIYNRYTLDFCANALIAGCPYCHTSYCEPPRKPRPLAAGMNWQNKFKKYLTNSEYDSILYM